MTQNIVNAIVEIADVVAGVSGISAVQATPRENANEYPFAMVYVFDGDLTNDVNGGTIDLLNIAIDVLVPREWDLSISLPILHPVLDSLKTALWGEVAKTGAGFFNNSVDTFSNIKLIFLPEYLYAGIEMIGYRLVLEQVKLVGTL